MATTVFTKLDAQVLQATLKLWETNCRPPSRQEVLDHIRESGSEIGNSTSFIGHSWRKMVKLNVLAYHDQHYYPLGMLSVIRDYARLAIEIAQDVNS